MKKPKRLVYPCSKCLTRISVPPGQEPYTECPVCGSIMRRPVGKKRRSVRKRRRRSK